MNDGISFACMTLTFLTEQGMQTRAFGNAKTATIQGLFSNSRLATDLIHRILRLT